MPDLASWPQRIGILPGDRIMLVADLTRIAWNTRKQKIRSVPRMLLDTFLDQLGNDGTLVVMTFNWDLKDGEPYDRLRSETISGVLGQAALEHPSFQRTLNPLHSFAVAGALQQEFMQCEEKSSFGPRSAFHLLKKYRFKLVVLDMDLGPAFTYLHHVEELLRVKYRRMENRLIKHLEDGSSRSYELYAKKPGYVNSIDRLEPELRAGSMLNEGTIDGSKFVVIDIENAHPIIERDIRNDRARKIVEFKFTWWLRDVIRRSFPARRPSRSALSVLHAADRH